MSSRLDNIHFYALIAPTDVPFEKIQCYRELNYHLKNGFTFFGAFIKMIRRQAPQQIPIPIATQATIASVFSASACLERFNPYTNTLVVKMPDFLVLPKRTVHSLHTVQMLHRTFRHPPSSDRKSVSIVVVEVDETSLCKKRKHGRGAAGGTFWAIGMIDRNDEFCLKGTIHVRVRTHVRTY